MSAARIAFRALVNNVLDERRPRKAGEGYMVACPSCFHRSGGKRLHVKLDENDRLTLRCFGDDCPDADNPAALLAGLERDSGKPFTVWRDKHGAALGLADGRSAPLSDDDLGLVREVGQAIRDFDAKHPPAAHAGLIGEPGVKVAQANREPEAASRDSDEDGLNSWTPVDLTTEVTDAPAAPSILGIMYPGRRHLVSGEPEALKSWLAQAACAERVHAGEVVLYLDFDGMGRGETLARMRALRLSDKQISAGFRYVAPDEPASSKDISRLLEAEPTFIVIDTQDPALTLHGWDGNASDSINRLDELLIKPFHRAGATVVIVDHVTKDAESRAYAIGSHRKVAAVDVHLRLELDGAPLTRAAGTACVVVKALKDRPGWHKRDQKKRIGRVAFTSDGNGALACNVQLGGRGEEVETTLPSPAPTVEAKVARYLQEQDEPVSTRKIEDGVGGHREDVREALAALVKKGHAAHENGSRGAKLHRWTGPRKLPFLDLAPIPPGGGDTTSPAGSAPPRRGGADRGEVVSSSPNLVSDEDLARWNRLALGDLPDNGEEAA